MLPATPHAEDSPKNEPAAALPLLCLSALSHSCDFRCCPNAKWWSAYAIEPGFRAIFARQCQKWECEVCGPEKRRKMIRRIIAARPNKFLTLTTKIHEGKSPRDEYDSTRRSLSVLMREMGQKYGKTEYVRILEATKRGYPHYHLLLRGPFWPREDIKTRWERLTGAWLVDIRPVKGSKHVAVYVAKYLTKQNNVEFTRQRVSASRGFWQKAEKRDNMAYTWVDWTRIRYGLSSLADFGDRMLRPLSKYSWELV